MFSDESALYDKAARKVSALIMKHMYCILALPKADGLLFESMTEQMRNDFSILSFAVSYLS